MDGSCVRSSDQPGRTSRLGLPGLTLLLARCRYCRLLTSEPGSFQVHLRALVEFLLPGLPYVFAAHPGPPARGLVTGSSAPPLRQTSGVEPAYVWPDAESEQWGAAIEPLYPGVPAAARRDARLHALLALADALRLGRPRERAPAKKLLEEAIGTLPTAACVAGTP